MDAASGPPENPREHSPPDNSAGVDPAGGDGVHPNPARQADCHSVGQGGDAALGRRVAFRVFLGLDRSGGRKVHHTASRIKIGKKPLSQIVRSRNPHL